MKNISEYVKEATIILNNISDELNHLEAEKKQIIARYKKATPEQKSLIERQMIESENKFKDLYAALSELSDNVKKIKNDSTS